MPKGPLVHCITNAVTAPFVADCVAAVGGRPIMAEDPADCAELAKVADGLCINLGQLTEQKREAILASLNNRGDRPWVLDPVGVGALPSRLEFAQSLLKFKPTIIRGNASEIYALATGKRSGSGIDQGNMEQVDWAALASRLPAKEVIITQAPTAEGDRRQDIGFAPDPHWFTGGVPLMGRLAGFGCAQSAVAATLNSGINAAGLFSLAYWKLWDQPLGTFRAAFLNMLHTADRAERAENMLPLYFVAGPQDCADLPKVLAAALAGGITAFQYRPKNVDHETRLRLGHELRALCREAQVPFIANDDVELALALDADGVHLGQGDGDPQRARWQLGDKAIIGLSVSEPDHWGAFDPLVVDYVGLGPFAPTSTKPDARKALGPEGLARLVKSDVPSVAIGGISHANAGEALATHVDGLAVVSAIAGAADPELAARNLFALVQSHFDV